MVSLKTRSWTAYRHGQIQGAILNDRYLSKQILFSPRTALDMETVPTLMRDEQCAFEPSSSRVGKHIQASLEMTAYFGFIHHSRRVDEIEIIRKILA
ncbi:hypothetical protein CY34DRAFT_596589 [Suillus luteus UH-Slu-Lm8-n1]|uniref:Uncharacterized protein n=1 Tax=Suillus luteus UH-Slu-Lm8-n1 TaxID=930992 RepID=A0A0D0ALN7_9AGAM|nr:hypothetical protein CY34DRAFT_596589 [Suillus luteus UH-Slu-Lm8-n1]